MAGAFFFLRTFLALGLTLGFRFGFGSGFRFRLRGGLVLTLSGLFFFPLGAGFTLARFLVTFFAARVFFLTFPRLRGILIAFRSP